MLDDDELDRLELEDQVQEVGKLTPREYARLRGMNAQLIYYHVRKDNLKIELCICGRKVLDVKTTDRFFEESRAKNNIVEVKHDPE